MRLNPIKINNTIFHHKKVENTEKLKETIK